MDAEQIIYLIGIFAWVLYNAFKKKKEEESAPKRPDHRNTPEHENPERTILWETTRPQKHDDKKTIVPETAVEKEKMFEPLSEISYKDKFQEENEENKSLEITDKKLITNIEINEPVSEEKEPVEVIVPLDFAKNAVIFSEIIRRKY